MVVNYDLPEEIWDAINRTPLDMTIFQNKKALACHMFRELNAYVVCDPKGIHADFLKMYEDRVEDDGWVPCPFDHNGWCTDEYLNRSLRCLFILFKMYEVSLSNLYSLFFTDENKELTKELNI